MPATDTLSRAFLALADPTRRDILSRLSHGSATVGELAAPFAMSGPAVSQHLKVLERAGLVERTAHAQWRTLTIRTEPLDEVAAWIARHRRHWEGRFDALEKRLREITEEDEH